MPTLSYLPPWTQDYSATQSHNVIRSSASSGKVLQSISSRRKRIIIEVYRNLRRIELPYFEYFIREVCLDGKLKFTDYFIDENGLQTGLIRIVNGSYSVETNLLNHTVSCQIEVF